MKHIIKYLLGIIIVLSIAACEKDEPEAVGVDSRLQEYFDRFAEEGAARGVIVDYDATPITGTIENIDEENVQGQCISNSARANQLLINTQFWNTSSDLLREFVIFHELGHCYLDRDHIDDETSNGACISIMHSGTSGCTNTYNSNTRAALLDELFMN